MLPQGGDNILAIEDVGAAFLPAKQPLEDIGIKQLRYIDPSLKLEEPVSGGGTVEVYNCSDLQKTIRSRANAVVAGNIFNSVAGNGCGKSVDVADNLPVAFWTGTAERILGPGDFGDFQLTSLAGAADAPAAIDVASDLSGEADAGEGTPGPIFMAVGFGPSCSLFNAQQLGGMTSVPVYRHVAPDQYNRFIGLFHVANAFPAAGGGVYANGTVEPVDQVAFVAVVDGAGDTKEEELGEWDGTRNTM
ncbi:MAG: hypothetical protein CSA21_07015 [Deltaproteobacteria bacterium]|nr:MAG: hypothetical protein CSA21_07015 [Deltaproteobacteria bacterium]